MFLCYSIPLFAMLYEIVPLAVTKLQHTPFQNSHFPLPPFPCCRTASAKRLDRHSYTQTVGLRGPILPALSLESLSRPQPPLRPTCIFRGALCALDALHVPAAAQAHDDPRHAQARDVAETTPFTATVAKGPLAIMVKVSSW